MADAYYAVASARPYTGLPYVDAPATSTRRAAWTALLCVGAGAVSQGAYALLTGDAVEPEAAVRYAFVSTLAVYAVVTVLLTRAVRTPLDWRVSARSVAGGLALGGGLAYVLLRGDLTTAGDPRLALLVSEGTLPHIAATVLIAVVAAPLCEEVLFRGLLLSSLAEDLGRRWAVWLSGLAFAVWHLSVYDLPYYTLFGVLFGALFLRGGLACSVAAHAAFNGTLVVAAVTYALGPGVTVTGHDVVLTAPPGWHAVDTGLHLRGPSAGEVRVEVVPGMAALDVDEAADRIASGAIDGDGFTVHPETARAVRLPAGDAVRVRVTNNGRDGDVVLLAAAGRVYAVELMSGGSPRVRADFEKMLRDLRVRS